MKQASSPCAVQISKALDVVDSSERSKLCSIIRDFGSCNETAVLHGFFASTTEAPDRGATLFLMRHWAAIATLGNDHALLERTIRLSGALKFSVYSVMKNLQTDMDGSVLPPLSVRKCVDSQQAYVYCRRANPNLDGSLCVYANAGFENKICSLATLQSFWDETHLPPYRLFMHEDDFRVAAHALGRLLANMSFRDEAPPSDAIEISCSDSVATSFEARIRFNGATNIYVPCHVTLKAVKVEQEMFTAFMVMPPTKFWGTQLLHDTCPMIGKYVSLGMPGVDEPPIALKPVDSVTAPENKVSKVKASDSPHSNLLAGSFINSNGKDFRISTHPDDRRPDNVELFRLPNEQELDHLENWLCSLISQPE